MIVLWVPVNVIDHVKNVGSGVVHERLCNKLVYSFTAGSSSGVLLMLAQVHSKVSVAGSANGPTGDFPGFSPNGPVIPDKVTVCNLFFSHRALTQDCVLPLTGVVTEAFTFNVNIRKSNRVKRA